MNTPPCGRGALTPHSLSAGPGLGSRLRRGAESAPYLFVRRAQRSRPTLGLLAAVLLAPFAFAQNAQRNTPPHIAFAYPAGGKQGTTFTMSLGGQNLNGATDVYVGSPGISAKLVGYERPLTQKEFNDLREEMQTLMEKRAASRGVAPPARFENAAKKDSEKKKAASEKTAASSADPSPSSTSPAAKPAPAKDTPRPIWTADDEKKMEEIRTKMTKRPNRQGNPAVAETETLEVTVMPEAALGNYELRLRTASGLSNPILVQVGQLPEITKPVVTATSNPPPRTKRDPNARPRRPDPTDLEITLPATVNGQILPGAVDRYRFIAKKGQHLTVAVSARTLIPYLADAVPGWFQATLSLFDEQGREVAYSDSFRFNPDPLVSYQIPEDGEYAVEIKDSIYRGREDFVYRIAIGELPFVTSIFPLGGKLTDHTTFQLTGWNLPLEKLTMDTKDKAPGTFVLSVRNRGQLSNAVRFALDGQPDCGEAEPNDRPEKAQPLALPIIVDGRIDKPGDEDVYKFDGKAGAEIIAESFARRLGSPLDSILTLTDGTGKTVASSDDYEDKGVGLMTHHADSRISTKLPADGTYYVRIADVQHQGGPEYGYRLRVSYPQPDFELRAAPASVNVRAGTHTPITVYALRHDDFAGEIVLALQDAPRGFALSGARIPAGQDKVTITLAAPQTARDELVKLTIVGAAMINGKPVGHTAVPAEDMMQAFAYHHLVPAQSLLVDVGGRPGAVCRVVTHAPVQIPLGGTAKLTIATTAARNVKEVQIELSDAPEGITVKSTSTSNDVVEIILACDAAKVKPGLAGNLILNAFGIRAPLPAAKGRPGQRQPLGSVPAIPFEVTAAPLAKAP
jgi:hypothetical protein